MLTVWILAGERLQLLSKNTDVIRLANAFAIGRRPFCARVSRGRDFNETRSEVMRRHNVIVIVDDVIVIISSQQSQQPEAE